MSGLLLAVQSGSTTLAQMAKSLDDIRGELAADPSFDQGLQALASFASISLALLTLFTNRRSAVLDEQRESGLPKGDAGRRLARPDIALSVATFAVLVTLAPVFGRCLSVAAWLDQDHTLRSMFSLVYLGFAGIFAWQVNLVRIRLRR